MSAALPRAMLFDLDNTLLRSDDVGDGGWQAVCGEAAEGLGVEAEHLLAAVLAERDLFWADPARHREGRLGLPDSRAIFIEHALRNVGCSGDPGARAMEIARRYSAIRTAQERLFPEAKDVLIALRAEGVRLGLLTNGAAVEQRSKVTRFDLTLLFDHINIEGETGLGKPEPETFQQAMRALGVKADQTWMVGDWLEFDVLPCHALGLTGIWIDRDGKGLPEGFPTCRVIQSLNELLDMKDTEAAHAEGKVHRT